MPSPDRVFVRFGQGKYDAEAEAILKKVNGAGVLLIVINGAAGSGFSASIDARILQTVDVPTLLRSTADTIESQRRR